MKMIDTNILVYFLSDSQGEHSERSISLISRILGGEETGYVPAMVVLECIHVLRTGFNVPEKETADLLHSLLSSSSLVCEFKGPLLHALDFASSQTALSFADCYHLALAEELAMTQIYSFDKKMDRYPGIEQIEP